MDEHEQLVLFAGQHDGDTSTTFVRASRTKRKRQECSLGVPD
jgi:hypothetical protein